MPTAISGLKNGDGMVDPPASVGASPIQRPAARPSAFGPLVERGYQQDTSRHPSAPGSGVSTPMPGFSSRDDLPAPSGEISAAPVEDDTFGIIGGRGGTGRGGGHRDPHQNHFHYRNTLAHTPTGYGRGSPHHSPSFPNRSVSGLSIANNVGRVAQQNAQEAAASVLGGHSSTIDAVRRQVEYYFSVENLTKDTYLLTKMNPRMMVPLSQILSFPKIKQKNVSDEAVLAAVKLSKGLVVEVVKDGQDIGDEGRPVLSGGVPHSDESDGNWWIGPYPYSLPSSGCTLEFHGVPDTATVGDIEELTPEFSLLHSYNFANGAWNATYMDAASAYSALHCMLSLTPNKAIDQPISGSTFLCGKVVSVAIKGGERLMHEMMNSAPTRHTPNTSPKGAYQAAGRRSNGGHQPITPVTIPPVPASSYNPNYPPGFMADMPTITVGKVPVRIPMTMVDSSIPPSSKSPCAPGGRYTNSPYSMTAPVTTLMGASTTSSTSPGTSIAAKSTTQQSTLNWADLDDDESADEDKPAAVATQEVVAKPAKKGGLVPIGEEDDDDDVPPSSSNASIGGVGPSSSALPTDTSLTRAQKEHFHNVTAVAWEQQTRLAANMLRQRRALEADEGETRSGGNATHPQPNGNKKSVPPKKQGNNKQQQQQKDSTHSKAGFGGSTAISKDDVSAEVVTGGADAAAPTSSSADPVAAAERKESIAGYSLKGYHLTRGPFGAASGGHHHRGGGGGGAPTPFALSGNRSMMEMMEMMSMMYGASFPNAEEGANARGWGRHGRPNAKASPFTGTQRVEEDVVAPTTSTSTDEPTAVIESNKTPIAAVPAVKAPTVLAALGADIDVAETNQRIAAAASKSISKKPSQELSTEGGHSDSTGSVSMSDDTPVPAAAVVRSGWVAIAAAASTKPMTRADTNTKSEEPAKKGERRQKKDGKKSERKPRGSEETESTAAIKAAPKSAAPAAAPVREEPVKVHNPPTPTAASPVAAEEPKAPSSSFLAAVMQRA